METLDVELGGFSEDTRAGSSEAVGDGDPLASGNRGRPSGHQILADQFEWPLPGGPPPSPSRRGSSSVALYHRGQLNRKPKRETLQSRESHRK